MSKKYLNPLVNLPQWGQKLVAFFLTHQDREAILGDLAEEYQLIAAHFGVSKAWRWYWLEILKSMPFFLFLYKNKLSRSHVMTKLTFWQPSNKLAVAGLVLSIPALLLVTGGLLQSGMGVTRLSDLLDRATFFIHPVILMGGLMLGFGLNLMSILQLEFGFQNSNLVSTVKIQGKPLNLACVVVGIFLLAVIFIYLLAENLQIFQLLNAT